MATKISLVICSVVLLFKNISGQCSGSIINAGAVTVDNIGVNSLGLISNGLGWANGIGLPGYGGLAATGYGAAGLGGIAPGLIAPVAAGSGGAFAVTSYSPLAPTGLTVLSENAIEGALNVGGNLPFLSAVGLEGQVPSGGAAGVSYSCGDGSVGIVSEGLAGAGLAGGYGYGVGTGLGNAGLLNAGWAGNGLGGCGCGRY